MIDDHLVSVFSEMEGGGAFDRSLETTVSSTQTDITTAIEGASDPRVSDAQAELMLTRESLNDFSQHIGEHFDNMSDNISLFASTQQLENSLSGSSKCSEMHSFFGSVTREGPATLSAINIKSALISASITELSKTTDPQLIKGLLDHISNLSAELSGQRSSLQNLISSEKALLKSSVKRLTTMSAAASIRSLFKSDPCVQTLMGYVGSDSLLKKLV